MVQPTKRNHQTIRGLFGALIVIALCSVILAQGSKPQARGEATEPDNTRVQQSPSALDHRYRLIADSVMILEASSQCFAAVSELCRGNLQNAKGLLRRFLDRPDRDDNAAGDALYYLARAHLKARGDEMAELYFRQALVIRPLWAEAEIGLMVAQAYQGQFDGANLTLQNVLSHSNEVSSEFLLASTLYEMGEYAVAKGHCEAALNLNPGHRNSLVLLAQCLFESDDPLAGESVLLRMGKEWSSLTTSELQEDSISVLAEESFHLPEN